MTDEDAVEEARRLAATCRWDADDLVELVEVCRIGGYDAAKFLHYAIEISCVPWAMAIWVRRFAAHRDGPWRANWGDDGYLIGFIHPKALLDSWDIPETEQRIIDKIHGEGEA